MLRGRTALLLLALGGSLAGHAVGYESVGHVHSHSGGLVEVHGYLPGAAGLVAPLVVVAFGWFVLRGARIPRPMNPGVGLGSLLALQIGIYGVQEVLERLVSPTGAAGVVAEPAVWGGLVAQVLVAFTVINAVRLLQRAVAAAVLLLFAPQALRAGSHTELLPLVSRVTPRVRLQAGPGSLRGPPVPTNA